MQATRDTAKAFVPLLMEYAAAAPQLSEVCLKPSAASVAELPQKTKSEPVLRPTRSSVSLPTGKRGGRAGFTLKMFELQRRTTAFQQDWRAPFLPHDHVRAHAWRWVDLAFHKHPWTSAGSIQQAAQAETPPIMPGGNWLRLGEWTVANTDDADTDSEGWQHSNNFYRYNSLWRPNSRACLVRRRLWVCEFVEQEPQQSQRGSDETFTSAA